MDPISKGYSFNFRSFYTGEEKKILGGGLELWRGYFQSIRPTIGRLLLNFDISAGVMYIPGPLIKLCLEFLGRKGPSDLSPEHLSEDRLLDLEAFVLGLRVSISHTGKMMAIKKLSSTSARELTFTTRDGVTMTVEKYFKSHVNKTLKYPNIICVEVNSFA
jgi:eukaryotic translation initiation factor 2C